tara:strand:- start:394 stop:906 length:513 start_codon:yes stop_codon:yes gene_type:complete
MYNNWKVDLKDSIKAMEKIKLTVLPKLIDGEIISIEESDNGVLLLFDKYSGIDYLRKNDIGLQGIASRIQFGNAWNTFTIRTERISGAKTEYIKRKEQIKLGYIYPFYTLQAYFDNRNDLNLLSICIIKTVDLYEEIETNLKVKIRVSDNVFKYINWEDIDNSKIRKLII